MPSKVYSAAVVGVEASGASLIEDVARRHQSHQLQRCCRALPAVLIAILSLTTSSNGSPRQFCHIRKQLQPFKTRIGEAHGSVRKSCWDFNPNT